MATYLDTDFELVNLLDYGKAMCFDASLITTGNRRTYKGPDFDGTIALLEAGNQLWTGGNIFEGGVDFKDSGSIHVVTVLPVSLTAGRAQSLQNANGVIALTADIPTVDIARTWGTLQTFGSGTFSSLPLTGGVAPDDAVMPNFNASFYGGNGDNPFLTITDTGSASATGYKVYFGLAAGAMASDIRLLLPITASGTLVTTTSQANISNKRLVSAAAQISYLNLGTSATLSLRLANGTSTTQYVLMDLASLTTSRTWKGLNDPGTMPLVVAPTSATTDKTGQTVSLAATTAYTTVAAGNYQIDIYAVFTAVIVPGAMTLTAGWTDPHQAQTKVLVNAVGYTAAGAYFEGSVTVRATAGSALTFATTQTGTGTYSVYCRAIAKS